MKGRAFALTGTLLLGCITLGAAGIVVGQQEAPTAKPPLTLPGTTPRLVVAPTPTATLTSNPTPAPVPAPTVPGTFDTLPTVPGTGTTSPVTPLAPLPSVTSTPPTPANTGTTSPEVASPTQSVTTTNSDVKNPTGRQEPAISLEWIGPPVAKLGQSVTYQLVVKNTSNSLAQEVVVRNKLPQGVTLQIAEPKGTQTNGTWVWEIGNLSPRQERRIDLQLLPDSKGDLTCHASVSFTAASTALVRVREPKLTVKATGPERVLLGDPASFSVTVTNPGDGAADQVKIKATLPEGLEHARGRNIDFDLGTLGPNESRTVQIVCISKTGGAQKVDVQVAGEGNLTASDLASCEVILPQVEIVAVGPKLRYLSRPASYTVKVSNTGSAAANNVTVTDAIPQGFKFISASAGGRHDFATRTVSWFVGDLLPAQSREVTLEVEAVNTGDHIHVVTANGARGIKAEAKVLTRVEGVPAILMELVDLDDPVEVGGKTAYEIRITNTGSKSENTLQLICSIPEKQELISAQGPGGVSSKLQGRELIFDGLPKLAPRADAIFRINVKALASGDIRFRARLTADSLSDPIVKEESTKQYE